MDQLIKNKFFFMAITITYYNYSNCSNSNSQIVRLVRSCAPLCRCVTHEKNTNDITKQSAGKESYFTSMYTYTKYLPISIIHIM